MILVNHNFDSLHGKDCASLHKLFYVLKKIGAYVCIAYAPVLDSAFKCSYCSTTTLSLTKLIITESLGNSSFFKRL